MKNIQAVIFFILKRKKRQKGTPVSHRGPHFDTFRHVETSGRDTGPEKLVPVALIFVIKSAIS